MEKLMQNATAVYQPALEKMAEQRAKELEEIRAKIRTSPEEVEAWFEKEIAKVGNVNINETMNKFNATAGI